MKKRISPWLVTTGLMGLAWIITYILSPLITPSIFILFIAATAAASYYGGYSQGLFATILAGLINYFFPPLGDTIPNFLIRYGTFLFTTFVISSLQVRKQEAETALALEIEKSSAITSSVNEGIISIDRNNRIVFANPAVEEMFGYSPNELTGQILEIIMPLRYRAAHRAGFNRYLKTNKKTMEWKKIKVDCLRKDGTEFPADISFSEYILGTDRMFTAVIRDMTEERHMEISAQAGKLFSENVKDYAMFVLDDDGNIKAWNKAADGVYGYTEAEVLGKPSSILYPKPETFSELWETEKKVAIETGKFEDTQPRKKKDGSLFSALLVLTPLYDEEGKQQGFLKLVRDITEYTADQAKMAQKTAELEIANQSKDNFLAILSHELRNPLVSILGYSNMLLSGKLGPGEQIKAINTIARNAKLQVDMIEDLLDISRIVSGKVELQKKVFPICEVARQAIDSFRPAAAAKGIKLIEEFQDRALFVLGDRRRIHQVMLNLLSNAIKFTEVGGEVRLKVFCEDDLATVEVSDNGIGISPERLKNVFDRFRQTSPADIRKHGGLGLGLSIVKNIVELHEGKVEAHSEGEGRGAKFTVQIPSCEGDVSSLPDLEEEKIEKEPEKVRLDGVKLLVVDDSDEARQLLTDMFRIYGAEVVSAESAADARKKLEEHGPFDVFVFDIGMPNENGYSLIKSLREQGRKEPALALTAFVGAEYHQAAIEAGFQDYMPKPPSIDYLLRRVGELAKE